MNVHKFLDNILQFGKGWEVESYDIDESKKEIRVFMRYVSPVFIEEDKQFKIYDYAPERRWQHLNIVDYKTFIIARLPRYEKEDGDKTKGVITAEAPWAEPYVRYTRLFCLFVIQILQAVKVQKTAAQICQTSEAIVGDIINKAVDFGLIERGDVKDLKHVSIDEKAFKKGHQYASILIDAEKKRIVNVVEGRRREYANLLVYEATGEAVVDSIRLVSMDMWAPFIQAAEEFAPDALICFDKFHIIKHLTEAIDKTRKYEMKQAGCYDLLKKSKYAVLKNAENRTAKQNQIFEAIVHANLETSKVWRARENFKYLWQYDTIVDVVSNFEKWAQSCYQIANKFLTKVVLMITRHFEGIMNAILCRVNNAQHEQCNANIQQLLARARGFKSFERFRTNVMFYFGKLKLSPLNFL